MKRILTFKHWQLFLLIVIPRFLTLPSPLGEIIHLISLVTFTIWIYSIGVYGQERVAILGLPNLDIKKFKTNIILITILLIIIYILPQDQNAYDTESESSLHLKLLIPVLLYFFFVIIQAVIFVCKTLAIIELKREVTFGDYFVNLILIGFLMIGVWVIQPKVTKLIADNDTTTLE